MISNQDMNKTVSNEEFNNNDFKYVIQDMNNVYFGKELTYAEMLDREDVPFKFKAIISNYISKDTDVAKKMSEHLLEIAKSDFSYRMFEQLKMSVKIYYKTERKGLGGRIREKWIHETCSVKQFCEEYRNNVTAGTMQMEDISISKLALMTISI